MQVVGETIHSEYSMGKLVDLIHSRDIHLGLDLNEEPMEWNDVGDQSTPIIVKLHVSMPKYNQISNIASLGISTYRYDEHDIFHV